MANLDGKVALITGAGGMKGIGRACALKLASQGADIVLSDFKRAPEDLPPQEIKARMAQHRQRRRRSRSARPPLPQGLVRSHRSARRSRTWRAERPSTTATSTFW